MSMSRVVVRTGSIESHGLSLHSIHIIECADDEGGLLANVHTFALRIQPSTDDEPVLPHRLRQAVAAPRKEHAEVAPASGPLECSSSGYTTMKRHSFISAQSDCTYELLSNHRVFDGMGCPILTSANRSAKRVSFSLNDTTLASVSVSTSSKICSVALHVQGNCAAPTRIFLSSASSEVNHQASNNELVLALDEERTSETIAATQESRATPLILNYHVRKRKNSQLAYCSSCNGYECNNGAVDDTTPPCTCSCYEGWTGRTCSKKQSITPVPATPAPTPVTPTPPPPTPAPPVPCTNAVDCSGNAASVTGNRPLCTCTCNAAWTGSTCATSNVCTNAVDCSGNAASVTGNRPQCTCTCNSAWTGSTCAVSNVCTDADCKNRASSFSGNRPSCTCNCPPEWVGSACEVSNVCTNSVDCSNHATSFSGNRPSCTCTCPSEWIGGACEISNVCTIAEDCSGHGTTVSGNRPNCTCTCPGEWIGAKCEISNVCTSAVDCNNRAGRVVGNRPACTCYCLAAYHGKTCDVTYTLTPTASHSHKPTYTRSAVDLSVSQTSSVPWTRSTTITQHESKSGISDSQSKSGSLLVSLTTTPSYSNTTTASTSPTKTSTFTSTTSVTRSSSISRSSTQASQSMRATTTEMGSATHPSVSVTLSFRGNEGRQRFFVNGSDDPNGPQNQQLGGASVSLSRSWTHPGNLSITASLRKSPTVTVSPSCTSNVHLAIRATQELLSTEAEQWCGGTAVGGVSSVGNGVNVSDNVVSESNTTLMPASCIVVPTATHGSITAQISRTTMASMVPPLKLIIPFTLNATDWDVERYTTATPTVDAATLNISALSVQWEYSLLTSASAVSNVTVNDSVATTIVLGNTIGAVEYRLDTIPAYSTVHAVVLRCQCGGRPVTTVFTVQWPDKVVLMTPAQEVLAGLATPLGPLSGDPTAAASMALMGAMSCSGEPITSASVAAYFISVFVDFGPASLALGNLGLAAAFCLLHAAAGAVYYRAVMKSDVTESLVSSTASSGDAENGCDHYDRGFKVVWWVQLCGAVRGPA
ncbi:transmembrane protein, putative [Bodo saltans]|uniref:Transmembrane protein, putative n=1 Tax=Bodo saltans TaxID=75058 RepID=A0A0S4JTV3_BODSA|nr:transmembrane protein, putative [Bodo saltans]|eukprot:CUG92798.1 transmembrane protein, putative [Bodo saltans]